MQGNFVEQSTTTPAFRRGFRVYALATRTQPDEVLGFRV